MVDALTFTLEGLVEFFEILPEAFVTLTLDNGRVVEVLVGGRTTEEFPRERTEIRGEAEGLSLEPGDLTTGLSSDFALKPTFGERTFGPLPRRDGERTAIEDFALGIAAILAFEDIRAIDDVEGFVIVATCLEVVTEGDSLEEIEFSCSDASLGMRGALFDNLAKLVEGRRR